MTMEEFLNGIEIIETVLAKNFNEKQIEIHYMLLSEIPVEKFMFGLKEMFLERVYTNIPSPAEIRRYCFGNIDLKIEEGKRLIKKAINNFGAYTDICFPDPLIHHLIKISFGSWVKLCKSNIEDLENYLKWDFPKLYKTYSERKLKDIPLYLAGISSSTNDANGINNNNQIYFVEEEEKCKRWINAYISKNKIEALNTHKVNNLIVSGIEINSIKDVSKEYLISLNKKKETNNKLKLCAGIMAEIQKPKEDPWEGIEI